MTTSDFAVTPSPGRLDHNQVPRRKLNAVGPTENHEGTQAGGQALDFFSALSLGFKSHYDVPFHQAGEYGA